MQLIEVVLNSFRSYASATVRLPCSGLLMVAGSNNVGKSALLSALDVIAGLKLDGKPPVAFALNEEAPVVSARFALDDIERRRLVEAANLNLTELEPGALSHVVLDFAEYYDEEMHLCVVHVSRPQGDFLTLSQTADPYMENASLTSFQLSMDNPWNEAPSQATSSRFSGPLEHNAESFLLGGQHVRPLQEMLRAWRTQYFHFRALRTGAARTTQLSSEVTLHPTGLNLPAVLLHLRTNEPEKFEELSTALEQIVPDVGRLQVPTVKNSMEAAFTSRSGPAFMLNIKDLGTGVEQLLLTTVVGLTCAAPFVMVLEEPETNLHPAAQRAMLSLLESWSESRLIIIATHSPVFLNWSPGGDRLLHVTRRDGVSEVSAVDEPVGLLRELGVRLSDILSADRILVVEGISDQEVLSTWFPHVLRSPRVALIDGGGGDNARHAALLASWLEGADRAEKRKILYLRDHDELPEEVVAKLKTTDHVYVTECRELENYLLDPAAIATAIRRRTPATAQPPEVADVEAEIAKAAEALRPALVVNMTMRLVAMPPVIDHKLRQSLAGCGADAKQVADEILARLVDPQHLREEITAQYAAAAEEVAALAGEALLARVPGADVLDAVYKTFLGRKFDKRTDGPEIAEAAQVPMELESVLNAFMASAPAGADDGMRVGNSP